MLSTRNIIDLQNQAAARAARQKRQPLVLYSPATVEDDVRRAPNLGLYLPKGWRRVLDWTGESATPPTVDEIIVRALSLKALGGSRRWAGHVDGEDLRLFVDKVGWGAIDEPALTYPELVSNLRSVLDALRVADVVNGKPFPSLGVGIVEEGQFQIYLGLFVKVKP